MDIARAPNASLYDVLDIGQVMKAIITYQRSEHPFRSSDDVLNQKGREGDENFFAGTNGPIFSFYQRYSSKFTKR